LQRFSLARQKMKFRERLTWPERWRQNKDKLDATTPAELRIHCRHHRRQTPAAPVLNRAGELVASISTANRHGLVRNFVYSDEQARHIAVHSRGVLEALRQLYSRPGAGN